MTKLLHSISRFVFETTIKICFIQIHDFFKCQNCNIQVHEFFEKKMSKLRVALSFLISISKMRLLSVIYE